MTTRIEYAEAVELLQRAVAEKGADYVYDPDSANPGSYGCAYFQQDGTPSCLVGHVIAYKGLTKGLLGVWNGSDVDLLVERGFLDLDERAQWLLANAQNLQDNGKSWGEALDGAIEFAEEVGSVED